jgi:UDP-N-acetyl-D-glucosamine dehydrogenase
LPPTRNLAAKVAAREARIAIVGLGYVGLPLCVEFAASGFPVIGIDVVPSRVASLAKNESYIADVPSSALADIAAAGRFRATTDFASIAEADAAIICVPTPLRKTRDPDISYVVSAVRSVVPHLARGTLVVLESTTYPGTTEEILVPVLKEHGLEAGRDVFVAFSPERIDPGNKTWTVKNTPKVVGGVTAECTRVAALLYGAALERVVEVTSPRAAEMVKLLENTFRAVNIGLVNELALMCERLEVDVWEVIEAAATKPFGYMKFTPGPGLGGHCIPIDPLYLSWKLRERNYTARFIELADQVNTQMPTYVVERAMRALNARRKAVNGARVLVLGVAYKRDVSDVRESPALDVIVKLEELGARVEYHDPFVPTLNGAFHGHGPALETISTDATPDVRAYDLVLIATDHSACDYARVVAEAQCVLDCRNATRAVREGREKIVKL